jgi:hypothetical protein
MVRSKLPPVPESAVQAQILQYLAFTGILAYRINSGMIKTDKGHLVRLAPAGCADIWGVIRGGRALFVECKSKGNKPTELQEHFLESMRKQGAVAFWADDLQTVIDQLKDML